MSLRTEKFLGIVLVGVMAGFALWGRAHILTPEMAVHFDLWGRPTGYAATGEGVWLLPAIAAVLTLLSLWVFPRIMPKASSIQSFPQTYGLIILTAVAFLVVIQAMLVLSAAGMAIDQTKIIFSGAGVLFIVIGNFLPKMRKNWLIGIRTPWTLSDERVWEKTHRFSGPIFVLGGFLMLLGGLLAPVAWRGIILLAIVTVTGVVSCGYSYFAARHLRLV